MKGVLPTSNTDPFFPSDIQTKINFGRHRHSTWYSDFQIYNWHYEIFWVDIWHSAPLSWAPILYTLSFNWSSILIAYSVRLFRAHFCHRCESTSQILKINFGYKWWWPNALMTHTWILKLVWQSTGGLKYKWSNLPILNFCRYADIWALPIFSSGKLLAELGTINFFH